MSFVSRFQRSTIGLRKTTIPLTSRRRFLDIRPISTVTSSSPWTHSNNDNKSSHALSGVAAAMVVAMAASFSMTHDSFTAADASKTAINRRWTPTEVAREDFDEMVSEHESTQSKLPVFTSDQVAENNGDDGKPIWVSYGGFCYDITEFVQNHPGGSEKILMAAGSALEPYWHIYRQHFASDLPTRLLEHMMIGTLDPADQQKIDEQMDVIYETEKDPFEDEPVRHAQLKVHGDQPLNAETPEHLLTLHYLTPSSIFFKRHHHPVPYLLEDQIENYKLEIDLSAYGKGKQRISLDDLKAMPKTEVVATLQCSGNRRSGFNVFERTSGTTWGQGAVSTAKWGGVRLSELLQNAGIGDPIEAQNKGGMQHVRMYAVDGVMASIGIEKAMNPYGDVIVAYEMNGEELPRDHGYPLRLIVPGYAGIRNVKWLKKIELSSEEAEGPWQRGLNYKVLPPSVHDASEVDLDEIPSVNELSVSSGITSVEPAEGVKSDMGPGDTVEMKVKGWAFSGGGRNIVRVDITGDRAKTWKSATLLDGSTQPYGRAWAWTFWETTVPATVQDDGSIHIYCKAVDFAFNTQPESAKDNWNVRGLVNNSWYKRTIMFSRPNTQ
ncbi:oxidoreductase [Nitzschia inconspicua]|uniref:sulfite oxidase n=1 Tax=Nitzschia inconspicua TaxID=303405 RepID=A0A9K3M3X9_9STRA|nr:oxidoreductase [Nitzschia inconspicua]